MPVSVNIAPNIQTTQTSNFHFTIVLSISESQVLDPNSFTIANNIRVSRSQDVDDDDFSVVSVSGNDVVIGVTLPTTETSGSFIVRVRGVVTIDGVEQTIDSTRKTINYDTFTSLGATFGTPEYRDSGIIAIPVTFAFDVIAPSATIFPIARVSGDHIYEMETWIVGEGTAYELLCQMPSDRKGRFSVGVNGTVFKEFSGNYDTVTATAIEVDWNTSEPRIVIWDIPANYDLGEPLDLRLGYNVLVTGWNANNTLTEIFLLEGANLGSPLPYKWTGTSPPDFTQPVPADLTDTNWTLLAAPPAGDPTPGSNGFDENGQWHGEEAQYYLIRFPDPQEDGFFNLTERIGGVLGPVS